MAQKYELEFTVSIGPEGDDEEKMLSCSLQGKCVFEFKDDVSATEYVLDLAKGLARQGATDALWMLYKSNDPERNGERTLITVLDRPKF